MKRVVFRYASGGKIGQLTSEEKKQRGLEYIEKLKQAGEDIEEINDTGKDFIILIKEYGGDTSATTTS